MRVAVESQVVEPGAQVLGEWPIAGPALVVAVATLGYATVAAVLGGGIDPLETAVFVAVFTATFVAFARAL